MADEQFDGGDACEDWTTLPVPVGVPTFTPSGGQFIPKTFVFSNPRFFVCSGGDVMEWSEPASPAPPERDTQVHNAIAAMKKAERE